MTLFRDLFGRPAPVCVIRTLKVLDCSDIIELAGMYGEARERGDTELMSIINTRMGVVIHEQGLADAEDTRSNGMTPTATTAILRQFNVWRRGADVPQQKPREIGKAIDAAIEMIERGERIESAAQNLVKMKGRHNTEIAYQRLVAALEKSK